MTDRLPCVTFFCNRLRAGGVCWIAAQTASKHKQNRLNMKKLLVVFCVTCAFAMALQVAEAKKERKLTEEQKTLQKDMLAKYDANKDGKLDKDERAKISAEDKQKMDKAGLNRKNKDKKKSLLDVHRF